LRIGGAPAVGTRRPAEPAAVEERIRAVVGIRRVGDETPAHLDDDLRFRVDACGAGSSTAEAGAALKERFVIREGSKLDICFLGKRTIGVVAKWPYSVFLIYDFANRAVVALRH
jgi:hypothetical protein